MPCLFEASGLRIGYGASPVVDSLSLQLAAGELVCLLGRSGCGKTSFLRALFDPRLRLAGRLWLDGMEIQSVLGKASWIPQDHGLLPWLRVLDNAASGAALQNGRWSEARERASRILADLGLSGLEQRWPATLSGGQQQRVALARALVAQSRVLLLDEPFSALDESTRRAMHVLLRQTVHGESLACLCVTHAIDEALAVADRILVLGGGPSVLLGSFQVPERAEEREALGSRILHLLGTGQAVAP